MSEIWCAEATLAVNGTEFIAPVAARGRKHEIADLVGQLAADQELALVSLSTPIDPANAPDDISRDLAMELDDDAAMGALAYKNSNGPDLTDPFIVSKLSDIVPLDWQFGVWPQLSVPEKLQNVVFGQPGGDLKIGTFALLDGARCPGLAEQLASSGLEHRCLFQGKARDDFADSAPWIVRLQDNNAFARNLFTSDPDGASWQGLWDNAPFVLVRSSVSLNGLWQHFRKFTQIVDEETNRRLFFRFYAPETLRTLIVHMTQADLQQFGKGSSLFAGPGTNNDMVLLHREGYYFASAS